MPRWPNKTLLERFEDKYIPEPNSGCWIWLGALAPQGYGMIKDGNNDNRRAHRISFNLFKGNISDELEIDHLCRNKACVNPDHLEAVTHKINVNRSPLGDCANYGRRTRCNYGHEFSGENLGLRSNGGRVCRTCHNARNRLRYHRNKNT